MRRSPRGAAGKALPLPARDTVRCHPPPHDLLHHLELHLLGTCYPLRPEPYEVGETGKVSLQGSPHHRAPQSGRSSSLVGRVLVNGGRGQGRCHWNGSQPVPILRPSPQPPCAAADDTQPSACSLQVGGLQSSEPSQFELNQKHRTQTTRTSYEPQNNNATDHPRGAIRLRV